MDNNALFKLTYGLYILTTRFDNIDNGCVINTTCQIASNPDKIAISVNKNNYTHELILKSKKFCVSTIDESADFDLFKRFGFQSGRNVNKFSGLNSIKRDINGIYYILEGCNSCISVNVDNIFDMGSHSLFVGIIDDMKVLNDNNSISYDFYQKNIKPKPQNTYTSKTIYRCRICGFEYLGENIPDDYICPICKHPKSDFEKISSK